MGHVYNLTVGHIEDKDEFNTTLGINSTNFTTSLQNHFNMLKVTVNTFLMKGYIIPDFVGGIKQVTFTEHDGYVTAGG